MGYLNRGPERERDMSEPSKRRSGNALRLLQHAIAVQFRLVEDQAPYEVIDERIRNGIHMRGATLWVLMFAILVASIGLNVNSAAVIIGAMLISPLMGPIMGVGYGVAIFDFELIKNALKSLGVAVLISLITSTIYFKISPLTDTGSELFSRTAPTIWDVLIALFGGLAGIVAATRDKKTNVVPGVAIATALMPPLCTAGYGLATGNLYFFLGAFYLFIINSVFIAFATILIVTLINPPEREYVDKRLETRVKRYVTVLVIVTVLPSIYLAIQLVKAEVFKSNAASFVAHEVNGPDVHVAELQILPRTREIEVTLIGERIADKQIADLDRRMANYQLDGAKLTIHQAGDKTIDVTALKTSLLSDLYKESLNEIRTQSKRISELEKALDNVKAIEGQQKAIAHELLAQYPQIRTATLSTGAEWDKADNSKGNLLIVKLDAAKSLSREDRNRIIAWLKVRTNTERVSIFEGK